MNFSCHSRWIGVFIMMAYFAVCVSTINLLQVAPLFFLGATLIFIGYDLLWEWVSSFPCLYLLHQGIVYIITSTSNAAFTFPTAHRYQVRSFSCFSLLHQGIVHIVASTSNAAFTFIPRVRVKIFMMEYIILLITFVASTFFCELCDCKINH